MFKYYLVSFGFKELTKKTTMFTPANDYPEFLQKFPQITRTARTRDKMPTSR